MGIPPSAALPQSVAKQHGWQDHQDTACSAIGNSFHMPTFMLFLIFISGFCCLFSLQTPKKFDEVKAA